METKSKRQIKLNLAIVAVRVANFNTRVGMFPFFLFDSAFLYVGNFSIPAGGNENFTESLYPPTRWRAFLTNFRDQLSAC